MLSDAKRTMLLKMCNVLVDGKMLLFVNASIFLKHKKPFCYVIYTSLSRDVLILVPKMININPICTSDLLH